MLRDDVSSLPEWKAPAAAPYVVLAFPLTAPVGSEVTHITTNLRGPKLA